MGKDIDIAGAVFKNGYAGVIRNAQMFVSENLLSTAVQTFSGVNVATKVTVINGVTFLSKATPAVVGDIDVGASATLAGDALVAAINNYESLDADTTGTLYHELTVADRATLDDANVTAVNAAGVVTITGAGRLVISTDETNGTISDNTLHAYFGKKGAIDLVVQDLSPVDMRVTDDRRGTNVFSSYLAGVKTFTDGSKQFLNVKIAA
jgi:hypothetical protein